MCQAYSDTKSYTDSLCLYNKITIGNKLTMRACDTFGSECFVLYKYQDGHIQPVFSRNTSGNNSKFLIAYIH